MILCLVSALSMGFLWDENKPGADHKSTTWTQYTEALEELKKREVLTVGIIESLWQAVLNIFIFAWTPILQSTTTSQINPGMVFISFVLMIITGTKLYEVFNIYLKFNLFLSMSGAILVETISFCVVLTSGEFYISYIFLATINGICGFYQPVNSIIKAKLLKEKVRALLMNIFRIPLNIYVVSALVFLRNLNPDTVSKIIITLYIYIYRFAFYASLCS